MSSEEFPEVANVPTDPWIHKIGKFVVAGIATFVASEAAEKAYDWALTAYRNKRGVS